MKWMIFFYNFTKKKLFGTWKFGKIDVLINFNFFPQFSQFFLWEVNLRGLRAFILQNVQGSVVETEKKVLLPITQLGKEETLIILLSAWDRSRDSTQKRNLSKHMWRTLNKRFLPRPNTTTAWKLIPHMSEISKNWNPPHWVPLHRFFKNWFLLIQKQLYSNYIQTHFT